MSQFLFFVLFMLVSFSLQAMEIIELKTQNKIGLEQFLKNNLEGKTLVLGEYHYDGPIQKAQAQLIWRLITREKLQGQFSVGWEFLEYDQQAQIDQAMHLWKSSQINDEQFLKKLFPNSSKPLIHLPYLDFMAATAKLDGHLIATNATRKTKKDLMDNGLASLPAKDHPDFMLEGSENYFVRFEKVMGEHVPAHLLQKYFLAQYYTDNIIGTYLLNQSISNVNFLIIGSFHNDYSDGVTRYLKNYSQDDIINIKMVNKSKLTNNELNAFKKPHPEFGYIADYLVVTE